MTDAKLINRFYTHVTSNNCQSDSVAAKIFQRIIGAASTHLTLSQENSKKIQELKGLIDCPVALTPFSIELWGLGQDPKFVNNSPDVINIEIEEWNEAAIRSILVKLESCFAKKDRKSVV